MADWFIRLFAQEQGNLVGEYSLGDPEVEVRHSGVGGFSGEIALGQIDRRTIETTQLGIGRDEFAPYRTNCEIWRQSTGNGVCITDGPLTSINLNKDRDTVLLSGKDWKYYLQRRVYPFTPEDYITLNPDARSMLWDTWPKIWPTGEIGDRDPIDIINIVRDILLSMRTGEPTDSRNGIVDGFPPRPTGTALGVPDITWNLKDTGTLGKYIIYPGDSTSIYDHIQKLAEMKNGFEWDILPLTHEFKVWSPVKYPALAPAYTFAPDELELNGAFMDFDWTNDGPNGTYLLGLGSGRHKQGATWTTEDNVLQFGRYDMVYDYGEVSDYDVILQKLKDQNDLWPQKKLTASLLNPEFNIIANFYTGGRPHSLLGDSVLIVKDFPPLHKVDAYFTIMAIKWNVDRSTNETVTLELQQIYDPPTGTSGSRGFVAV